MYNILLHLHSVNRWIVLILIVLALYKAFSGWFGKKEFTASDKKSALFALIFTHIQLILGLGLYFISPLVSFEEGAIKSEVFRFYTIEHFSMMIIAIVLIIKKSAGKYYKIQKSSSVLPHRFTDHAILYSMAIQDSGSRLVLR